MSDEAKLMTEQQAHVVVWMEMRVESALREAAQIAVYAKASEKQFLEVALSMYQSQAADREQRVYDKTKVNPDLWAVAICTAAGVWTDRTEEPA